MDNSTVIGTILGALITAIGWLGKRLYDAPRPEEVATMRRERDELRKVLDQYANEARQLAQDRDIENRKLKDELAELKATIEQRTTAGTGDAIKQQTQRPRQRVPQRKQVIRG